METMYMFLMGFVFIGYACKFDKQIMRIQWKSLAKWLVFLIIFGSVRYMSVRMLDNPAEIDFSAISGIPWWSMVLAGFEEAMFTLPVYYIMIHSKNRLIKYGLMAAISLTFAYGHIYQGAGAMVPTFIYMFIIAPRCMKRLGFGTMVLAHIMYDLHIFFTVHATIDYVKDFYSII